MLAGTRNVTINNASQNIGDFTTLRNLTLNSNAGQRSIPPGTYGNFTANGGSGFIIGAEGATQPSTYNLQSLTLNSGSQLQVVGPVVLTLASGMTLSASAGSSITPAWLRINIASGGLTLNSASVLYGTVIAPSGNITINSNGRVVGNVVSNRLTINSNGILQIVN